MKKIKLICLLALSFPVCVFSQKKITLKDANNDSVNYMSYFGELHKISKEKLNGLKESNYCYVTLTIGSDGKLTNFDILKIPDLPLEKLTEDYLKFLFLSADGNWNISNSGISKKGITTLMFSISIVKSDQNLEKRSLNGAKMFEYNLTQLSSKQLSIGIPPGSELPLALAL